ncbi:MAG: hypothetical protein M3Y85_00835, partial [Bacteroidota bacterium]|nr:hypothetical protein [Bacteroidota bacterium]
MRKLVLLLLLTSFAIASFAQKKKASTESINTDSLLLSKVKYRLVGPFRGGRSAAVTGSFKS